MNTARDVGPIGKDLDTGAGIVDAAAAGIDIIRTRLCPLTEVQIGAKR